MANAAGVQNLSATGQWALAEHGDGMSEPPYKQEVPGSSPGPPIVTKAPLVGAFSFQGQRPEERRERGWGHFQDTSVARPRRWSTLLDMAFKQVEHPTQAPHAAPEQDSRRRGGPYANDGPDDQAGVSAQ